MSRNGSPDDPNNDPTQYANYGGSSSQAYSDYSHDEPGYGSPTQPGQFAPAASTWHRQPAVLIGLGILTAVVLAFLVYAVVKFVGGGSGPAGISHPPVTSSATPPGATTTGANTVTSTAPSTAGTTETITETQTPTTSATPTTTTAPPTSSSTVTSTTTSVTTSTSTVTVTTSRAPWTLPTLFPRPKDDG